MKLEPNSVSITHVIENVNTLGPELKQYAASHSASFGIDLTNEAYGRKDAFQHVFASALLTVASDAETAWIVGDGREVMSITMDKICGGNTYDMDFHNNEIGREIGIQIRRMLESGQINESQWHAKTFEYVQQAYHAGILQLNPGVDPVRDKFSQFSANEGLSDIDRFDTWVNQPTVFPETNYAAYADHLEREPSLGLTLNPDPIATAQCMGNISVGYPAGAVLGAGLAATGNAQFLSKIAPSLVGRIGAAGLLGGVAGAVVIAGGGSLLSHLHEARTEEMQNRWLEHGEVLINTIIATAPVGEDVQYISQNSDLRELAIHKTALYEMVDEHTRITAALKEHPHDQMLNIQAAGLSYKIEENWKIIAPIALRMADKAITEYPDERAVGWIERQADDAVRSLASISGHSHNEIRENATNAYQNIERYMTENQASSEPEKEIKGSPSALPPIVAQEQPKNVATKS